MNKAAELLQGGTRISEVAAQVGFTSSSYFAKCFKAQYGVLPKEYVNQLSVSDTAVESTPDADYHLIYHQMYERSMQGLTNRFLCCIFVSENGSKFITLII